MIIVRIHKEVLLKTKQLGYDMSNNVGINTGIKQNFRKVTVFMAF